MAGTLWNMQLIAWGASGRGANSLVPAKWLSMSINMIDAKFNAPEHISFYKFIISSL